MTYTERDDWTGDIGRHDPQVHYRIYATPDGAAAVIICAQDFDYPDYDARRILSPESYRSEADAEAALLTLMPVLEHAEATVSTRLDGALRGRLIASAVRATLRG